MSSLLVATLPWTLILVGSATVISFLIGTLLGITAAWRRRGSPDRALPGLIFLQATPYFFLALLAVELFALRLHVFPAGQGYSNGLIPGWNLPFIESAVYHSLLPALTIVLTSIGGWMLGMRNVMITTLGDDYVLATQAKGLRQRRVMFTYTVRNAMLPNISAFAMTVGRPHGAGGAVEGGGSIHLPADMVLRSVGYRGVQIPGLPFDAERGVIPNAAGPILRHSVPVPGEYVAGWIKRGPSGIIGTNKHDATETVRCLLEDAPALPRREVRDPDGIIDLLHQRGVRVVPREGWEAIEALELAAGRRRGAKQVKVAERELLLAAAARSIATEPEVSR